MPLDMAEVGKSSPKIIVKYVPVFKACRQGGLDVFGVIGHDDRHWPQHFANHIGGTEVAMSLLKKFEELVLVLCGDDMVKRY